MTFVRHYHLKAADGRTNELLHSLNNLTEVLKTIEGFNSAELFVYAEKEDEFVFLEQWTSRDAHGNSAAKMPKTIFQSVMDNLADRPQVVSLQNIKH